MHISNFSQYSSFKKKYLTLERAPFFELAAGYIQNADNIVLDIGSGEGDFFNHLKKKGLDVTNVFLLDGNKATVEKNRELTGNSIFYLAPETLPFANLSVDYIHLSHLIDNLSIEDFYAFLVELNRVLKPGGILVISTPMLWSNFYDDLSHTKPYNPYVFFKYFVQQSRNSRFEKIQHAYSVENLVYRYYELPLDEGWSSTVPLLDAVFISVRRVFRKMGIKRLYKNGYTLVLRKANEQPV